MRLDGEFHAKTADKKDNWQHEILTAGGTDTANIQRMTPGGSIAGAFSMSTRDHQVIEMVQKDVSDCIDLMQHCLIDLDTQLN